MPSFQTATAMPKLWSDLSHEIRHLFSEDIYREWFQPLVCTDATENTLTLRTPTEFSALWISQNYLDILNTKAAQITGCPVSISLHSDTPDAGVARELP
ncbi:MAG: hypothetical protein JW706_00860, partial [Opitutales bacterium]|nr:hypothetical protein [Opitutales bacterium]